MKTMIIVLIFFGSTVKANVPHNLLSKYKKNDTFVCTKIGNCKDIEMAIYAGFSNILGLEDDELFVNHAKIIIPEYINYISPKKLKSHAIHHDPLRTKLSEILQAHTSPVTLFLNSYDIEVDAQIYHIHVLEELATVKSSPCKDHTILIDYIHEISKIVDLKTIFYTILSINPLYKFQFDIGGHLGEEKNALLIASL